METLNEWTYDVCLKRLGFILDEVIDDVCDYVCADPSVILPSDFAKIIERSVSESYSIISGNYLVRLKKEKIKELKEDIKNMVVMILIEKAIGK